MKQILLLNLRVLVLTEKRINKLFTALIAIALLLSMACKKEEKPAPPFTISGNWRVSYYVIGTTDLTADFAGYTFVFNDDSSFVASHNGISETGSWSYNSGTIQFEITFSTAAPLNQISKTWLLILKSDSEIILDEDSTVNDEELHFFKN